MKCVAKKLNNCKFYFREQKQKKKLKTTEANVLNVLLS